MEKFEGEANQEQKIISLSHAHTKDQSSKGNGHVAHLEDPNYTQPLFDAHLYRLFLEREIGGSLGWVEDEVDYCKGSVAADCEKAEQF